MSNTPVVNLASLLPAMNVDRRDFLGVLAGSSALALPNLKWFLPSCTAAKPVIVQVHHENAVAWDYRTGWYGDYVNQSFVDVLLDRALLELTGSPDVASAWRSLLPGYAKGRKIAIKMNFNCCLSCYDSDNYIDGMAEPANAIIRGLSTAGVAEDDIWVYDAVRYLPVRFLRKLRSKGVVTFSRSTSCGSRRAAFSGTAANSVIRFTKAGVPSQIITDVLIQADYLINLPITKQHCCSGITLSYKNHFGTIHACSQMHPWTFLYGSQFSTSWSPLVEIMANPHVGRKTVLTVADCLYGDYTSQCGIPKPWQTFGGKSPATLILAKDSVALDCVQRDILFAERQGSAAGEAYLKLAGLAGQGVYESTPTTGGYKLIDHRKIELKGVGWFKTYAAGKAGKGGLVPTWRFSGMPAPGTTVEIEVTKGLPGTQAIVVLGRRQASTVLPPFGTLVVDPVILAVWVTLDGSGAIRIPLAIPPVPGTLGAEFTFQAFMLDPAAQNSVSHTEGLQMHIGRKL